jgi:hypothetical protein
MMQAKKDPHVAGLLPADYSRLVINQQFALLVEQVAYLVVLEW